MKRMRAIVASLVLVFGLGIAGYVAAQQFTDPCQVYPHQSGAFLAGTPTAKLVAGVVNKSIYVCAVHMSNAAAAGTAIAMTFYSGGEANASGTPCATATTGGPAAVATLGAYAVTAGTVNIGDGNHSIFAIPTVTSGFPIDFCGLMGGGTGISGSFEYVQR